MVKKNILFLHLESISRANLWQYRNELGTVWRLMSGSYRFDRFITASTSTTMTMSDFAYGDSSVLDACPTYKASRMPGNTFAYNNVKRIFLQHGHRLLSYHSSQYSPRRENVTADVSFISEPNIPALCEAALAQFAQSRKEKRPFCAYFWDASSHLAYVSPHKDKPDSLADRLRVAYSLVDASLNRLLSGMAEMGIWDDTVIVGFGDHGDEAWSHGFNRGYCHSIVPYASVTWTPMFIYHPSVLGQGATKALASSVDIKKTALNLFFPGAGDADNASPFAGIDLLNGKQDVVFSHNMFALQKELSDPEQGMIKGYAAVDADYRLVVSSGGDNPRQGGMELYHEQSDPSNSLNLLKFFKLDRSGDIREFSPPPDAVGKHFNATFRPEAVDDIRAAFGKLKPLLAEHVKERETRALERYQYVTSADADVLIRDALELLARDGRTGKEENLRNMFAALKKEFADTPPQLFPEKAFTMVRKVV